MKHFGSHPNKECRNEFSAYSTDVMFGQWFLTLAHQIYSNLQISNVGNVDTKSKAARS